MEYIQRSSKNYVASSLQGNSPPQNIHGHHTRQLSSISHYGRPSSIQGSIRPSTSQSILNGTPCGSLGLNFDFKVESRPLTQQGLMTSRSDSQGHGRQVQDRSYYLSKLKTQKQELQAEIDLMNNRIDKLQKKETTNIHLEHKQKALNDEIMELKTKIGDYNVVMEKVSGGVELHQVKDELKYLKEKNDTKREKIDHLFTHRNRREQNLKVVEDKIQVLEAGIKKRIDKETPEIKAKYVQLEDNTIALSAKVEDLECDIQNVDMSIHSFEQELSLASPIKQKATRMIEQLLNAKAQVTKLKDEEIPNVQPSREEAREAMLSKIRQDNVEIAKAEEKIKHVEDEVKGYEGKIVEVDKLLFELKGGRAEKFLEMQQKEKKMQDFIDNFDAIKLKHKEATQILQENITQLLKKTNQGEASTNEAVKKDDSSANKSQPIDDIDDLFIMVEERQQELNHSKEVEEKNLKELTNNEAKVASLKVEIDKFGNLDDLKFQWETKCKKLEEENKSMDESRTLVQNKLKEKYAKVESIKTILNENEVYTKLEELKQRLFQLQQSGIQLQEEVDFKERETNYKPILENVRFMVGQLNSELKAHNATLACR